MKGKFQKKSANIFKKKYWRLIIECDVYFLYSYELL